MLMLAIATQFVSCATSTTVPYSTEHENTWFLENRGGVVSPIYCLANKTEKGANPKCYKAQKLEY